MKRRQFLQNSLGTVSAMILPRVSWGQTMKPIESTGAQFILHIEALGGVDQSYLFDARPLSLVNAGKIHAHAGRERFIWSGKNGTQTLTTDLCEPLRKYQDYFSVINGVHMFASFEGHEENLRYLVTGNPFGAENYLPHLNNISIGYPLDGINASVTFLAEGIPGTNTGNIVPLSAGPGLALSQVLKTYGIPDPSANANSYLNSVFERAGTGEGRFPTGAKTMYRNFFEAPKLGTQLQQIDLSKPSENQFTSELNLLLSCFKQGITNAGILQLVDPSLTDIHDTASAQTFRQMGAVIIENIVQLIDTLRETPFDDKQSFFDVTTFVISSEFARTMRQEGLSMEDTGTDHNPLNNTIIIGGKGVNAGLILGASDFQTANEKLSGAHNIMDPIGIKTMGKPFDFITGKPQDRLPEKYLVEDYLGANSVINSIYKIFGAPKEVYRPIRSGNSTPAPFLNELIKN